MSTFFAFLHHVAAFALVAGLAVELALMRGDPGAERIRRLARADRAVGISATLLLLVGLARVFHFEKGAAYYFHNWAFIGKLSLFLLVALLSIYPTVKFISWSKALKRGETPSIDAATLRKVRMVIHTELAAILPIVLFAAMMARGIGVLR
jgi:putative membrane protein